MTPTPRTRQPRRIAALLFLLSACAMSAAAAPAPYVAEYEVMRNGEPLGRGNVSLTRADDGTWEFLSVTRATAGLAGLAGAEIIERSTLRWRKGRLETIAYAFRQDVGWKSRARSVQVDRAQQRIVSRDRDQEHVFPYAAGVLDRQAVVLALAQDLDAGKRGVLAYVVVDRDQYGPQRYRVGAEELVATAAGDQRALRVERVRAESHGRTTTSWLGLDHGFLPVRVLQHEPDGDSFEMRLVSMQRR